MRRVFADDWRDTLREQYKYVIRQDDKRTEETLTVVLHQVGFSDDELAALRLEATMRAEDMPDDYVPEEVTQAFAGVDVPAEVEAVDEPVVDDAPDDPDEEAEAVTYDELVGVADVPAPDATIDDDIDDSVPEDDDDDAPEQLSMF